MLFWLYKILKTPIVDLPTEYPWFVFGFSAFVSGFLVSLIHEPTGFAIVIAGLVIIAFLAHPEEKELNKRRWNRFKSFFGWRKSTSEK